MKKSTWNNIVGIIVAVLMVGSIVIIVVYNQARHCESFKEIFAVEYPGDWAERQAIQPIVVTKLQKAKTTMKDAQEKAQSFRKRVEAIPTDSRDNLEARTDGFRKYQELDKAAETAKDRFVSAAREAARAGFKEEAEATDYFCFMSGGGDGGL